MEGARKMAADTYKRSDIMTASGIKAHQMLLDKALLLMKSYKSGDVESQSRIQNILSQIQSSLNLAHEPAQEIFATIAPIWDAVDTGDSDLINKASATVEYLRDTLVIIQKKI
jgi:flagellin-specific chaperone FliS